jgi:ankyrin repeat protein
MEIEDLLDLIELIMTQKDEPGAFAGAISKRKFCFFYFDYLLSEGFLPDGIALLAATKMRQIEIVRFILEHGVRPTLESFQYAAEHEFFELCRLFVEFGSREILSTPELEDELIVAIDNGEQKTAINLIKQGINIMVASDRDNEKAIQLASRYGYTEIVRLLLEHGVNIMFVNDEDNDNAIQLASRCGYIEIVRLLLKHGADPKTVDNYAIKMASRNGYTEIVRLLLKHGADPKTEDNWAIKMASHEGHLDVVRLLLENGASL